MTAKPIKLVAPNELPIVGIRLEDGSVCEFEYVYDSASKVRYFKLLNRNDSDASRRDGDQILVDSGGNEWLSTDIEFDSIFKG